MTTHSTFFAPRFSLFCLLFLAYLMAKANNNTNQFVFPNPYQTSFEEAYKQYPTIPPGVLQAIAYSNTRMRHLTPQNTRNACSDMPRYYGVMGLIADGKNWFRDNLQQVANLSGYKPDDLYRQPEKQIMAYAAAFSALQQQLGCTSTQIEHNLPVLYALSELPESPNPQADFALNSQIYQILYWLNHPQFRATYGLNNANAPQINIAAILGPTVYAQVTAASQQITIPANLPTPTTPNSGPAKNPEACTMPDGPAQYSSALWVATTNYSSYAIEPFTVAIHTMQGTYAGSISWFQNPDAQASAHYCVRAFDGQITQMACHTARAWHVTSQNSNAVGIEHEGFVEDGNAWYTNAMYQSSAQLTQFIAADRSINTLQTYDGPPTDGLKVLSNECHKIKGHQHFPDQTHIDPGPFWDWERYYLLINTLPKPQANYQSQTDTIYDSGGATNNYQNEERKVWRISPTDAKTVTLTFKTFDIEKDWDFLWIYDGPDNTGALIGKYSGNTLPGVITAYSGKMCLEFRSDCATTKSGWMAVYNASYSDAACPAPNNLAVTNLYPFGATLTWSESDKTTGYNLRYKRDFATDWTNINTDNTSLALTGLIHNAVYQWQVRSQCGTDQSGWVGSTFTTPAAGSTQTSPGSYTTTACEGIFTDSGGTEAVYSHYEDWTYTIAPAGATGLTLQFTNFETENNFDVLWIYDGLNTNAPLLGKFSGTSSPGTINATGGALTLRFTSDKATYKNGWQANWQCSGLPQCLPTTLINPLPTWITNDCEATFVDSDCAVGYTGFYAPLDYSSEWRANGKAGFFNDEFGKAQLHADWVTTLGTWATNNGVLQQTNQTLTNTNLYAALNQTQDGTWLYEFDGKISGTNADRRAGLHFFCSDPAATNRGDSYFVWLRADGNKAQIYRTKDNVFTLEAEADALIEVNTWYNYRITYHPASGKINFYQNGNLLVTFTDTNAYKSGQGLSLRSGNSLFEVDNLRVYRSRLGSATTITVGSDPTDMVRYQSPNPGTFGLKLYSIILADNGLWSNTTYQATKIDWTPPVVNWVNDGNDKDEAVTFDKTQLTANWHVGYDAQSGVAAWYIAVGTAPATDDIKTWQYVSENPVNLTGLNLLSGIKYFISIKAENNAGLIGDPTSSNGIFLANTDNSVVVQAQAWLQGAYVPDAGKMHTALNNNGWLPEEQPYAVAPFNYAGWEATTNVPTNAVDWVLVELRDALSPKTVLETRAAFILDNGFLADLDGSAGVKFYTVAANKNYWVALKHRNHLGIATQAPVLLPNAQPVAFTQPNQVLQGLTCLTSLPNTPDFALVAGNASAKKGVNTLADFNALQAAQGQTNPYHPTDTNLDGQTTSADLQLWLNNASKIALKWLR